jgi:hypothetical protein
MVKDRKVYLNLISGLPASFHYAVFLNFYEGLTQTLSGLPASFHYAVFLNFYEGLTQTLSGLTKLRFVVPSELGVPKPFQDCRLHFITPSS